MTKTVLIVEKFQNGAGLSGYVAELGSVFLAADLGLAIEPRDDHAAYIASWLEVLKGDKRAIFTAASHAERAVAYLHGLQPDAEAPAAEDDDADPDHSEDENRQAA